MAALMTPRFRAICRQAPSGWLGWVELDESEWAPAIGPSKDGVLEILTRTVQRRAALPVGSFELFEDTRSRSRRPPSYRPAMSGSRSGALSVSSAATKPRGPGGAAANGAWLRTLFSGLFG
jgi:hypothetical protein